MSFASNLALLARLLTAAANGIVNGPTPVAGDNTKAFITSEWFKAEQASEANQGTAKVATQAITNAGTDDTTIVTPKKLRAGFAFSFGTIGYLAFPTWLGGLIIQWGFYSLPPSVYTVTISLPIAFPNAYMMGVICDSGQSAYPFGMTAASKSQINLYVTTAKGANASGANWIAIGN
ncbi:gp53-like domain-containing protein [Paraburkholderia fungorum]|uniref:gp53-like domain-containing protein n=1 Tax=Paraburkholderia fungorum TaxID=134537 RepID=UPI00387808B8